MVCQTKPIEIVTHDVKKDQNSLSPIEIEKSQISQEET